jgi:hypothetical protein
MKSYRVRTSKAEYAEYLRSQHWRGLRAEVLIHHPICQRCARCPSTDVHHLRYKNLVDVTPNDLLGLCSDCHTKVHQAIEASVINNPESREQALTFSDETVHEALSARQTKVEIPFATLAAVNVSSVNVQKRVCGVLKILHPGDFTTRSGIKTTPKRLNYIQFMVRRSTAFRQQFDARYAENRQRKDAARIVALIQKQGINRLCDGQRKPERQAR